jgi:predicted O-methyltransferase YrrM
MFDRSIRKPHAGSSTCGVVRKVARLASGVLRALGLREERLGSVPRIPCDASRLGRFDHQWLASAWESAGWEDDSPIREAIGFPESAGGVNLGDQRALYQLVRQVRPTRILEIGTHIGCSTVSMALAVRRNSQTGHRCVIDTVDIRDVNDEGTTPWAEFGSPASPRAVLTSLGLNNLVEFHVSDSCEYLRRSSQRYDLIFLDGNHDAACVYREIPLALNIVAHDGLVILHDFFPDAKPLWPGEGVISGPWKAVDRFHREGANFRAIPIGSLPWPTKCGTHTTSLGILSAP